MLNIPNKTLDTSKYPKPILCIVIDTEEEFDWSAPFDRKNISIKNISQQIRAQEIFSKYGIKPTYVIDYPVASQEKSITILKQLYDNDQCDIGAHLHPWVTPPYTEKVNNKNSFPGNLSYEQEYEKLKNLTDKIQGNFEFKPAIYKAGRYGIGQNTTKILNKLGYKIDCSIVPNTNFSNIEGPNFTHIYNTQPYWFNQNKSLEVPLTVDYVGALSGLGTPLYNLIQKPLLLKMKIPGILSRLGLFERIRLSPEGHTLDELKRLTRHMIKNGQKVFTLTYHSSTLLAGGSPYVKTEQDVIQFLKLIDDYLHFFSNEIEGEFKTVAELHH